MSLEILARRVYELHRGRVPWDRLPEAERSRLIAAYWRTRSQYEAGRREPREVRIEEVLKETAQDFNLGLAP